MKKSIKIITAAIAGICLIITALYISVAAYAFDSSFYASEFEKNGTYQELNMEKSELDKVAAHLIDYIAGDAKELNISAVVDGEERLFFSKREVEHMVDVKVIFNAFTIIAIIAACFMLVCVIWYKRKGMIQMLSKYMLVTILCTVSAISLFAVFCIIDFDGMFTLFHKVLFTNDLWLLDPSTDLLINIVPLQFFIDIAANIGVVFVSIVVAAGIMLAIMMKKRNKKRSVA